MKEEKISAWSKQNSFKTHCSAGKVCLLDQMKLEERMWETHKIKLSDETPIKEAPRKIPLFKRDVIDAEVERKVRGKGSYRKIR